MKIKVTQSHIIRGFVLDCVGCPVALAVAEATGRPTEVNDYICIDNSSYDTPDAVVDFINAFDNGLDVAPFEFELNYP